MARFCGCCVSGLDPLHTCRPNSVCMHRWPRASPSSRRWRRSAAPASCRASWWTRRTVAASTATVRAHVTHGHSPQFRPCSAALACRRPTDVPACTIHTQHTDPHTCSFDMPHTHTLFTPVIPLTHTIHTEPCTHRVPPRLRQARPVAQALPRRPDPGRHRHRHPARHPGTCMRLGRLCVAAAAIVV